MAALTGVNLLAADPGTPPVAAAQTCDVYLTPFTAISNDNSLDWMGKAVEQNLLTDLARAKLHPQAADKPLANPADAQAAAKAAGAKYLIAGSYQVADQQVRFNAQLIDAGTGNVLGGISTTGAVRDLFTMEDALSSQALQQLGQLPGLVVANNKPVAPAPAVPAAAAQPPVVVQIVQAPAAPAPAPVATTRYQGSALEQYVNANRNPSSDYSQPPLDSQLNDNFASTPGTSYNAGFGIDAGTVYSGYGLGYGYGFGPGFVYSLPPYGRYGYGTTGHIHRTNGNTLDGQP